MGDRTKIDWCDASWNPVTGCLHGCPYCYARSMVNRFKMNSRDMGMRYSDIGKDHIIFRSNRTGDALITLNKPYRSALITMEKEEPQWKVEPYPAGFNPTFHRYRLDMPKKWKTPRTIFVCSMSDLFGEWVPDDWIQEVLDCCRDAPQHRYLFLTKNPKRYDELKDKEIITGKEENFWLGSTMAGPANPFYSNGFDKTFISIEPILRPFTYAGNAPFAVSWVIVGAETGNRKDKVIPKKEWILEIVEKCRALDTPIFMKESLREIMGADFIQEFPWEAGYGAGR